MPASVRAVGGRLLSPRLVALLIAPVALSFAVRAAATPLPWSSFADAAATASDRQPFHCRGGEEGIRLKLRGGGGGVDSYGYFAIDGARWIIVRYPDDRMANPDHVWFGTYPAGSQALDVTRDEPFDPARHHGPCAGWLLGPPPDGGPVPAR